MKKSQDIIGDIFRALLAVGAVVCVLAIISAFSMGQIAAAFITIGVFFGCLFLFWLISAVSKIVLSLKSIEENIHALNENFYRYATYKMTSQDKKE